MNALIILANNQIKYSAPVWRTVSDTCEKTIKLWYFSQILEKKVFSRLEFFTVKDLFWYEKYKKIQNTDTKYRKSTFFASIL